MSSSPRYYYVDAQNQAAGPIPLAELQSLHASSTIGDSTLVVLEGGQDWVAFSTIKPTPQPAPQPAPQPTSSQPVASLSISPKIAQVTTTSPSLSLSSSAEPAWATQLLQKVDQLTLAAEKIVAALEKNAVPRQMPAPAPATAALHAEKISLNPIPKLGLAQATTSPAAAPIPRPGVSTPLSPMAVPANAVKPSLPLPALGKPGTPTPVATPEKSGNLFSKFLKK
jgi:hypothetical protein